MGFEAETGIDNGSRREYDDDIGTHCRGRTCLPARRELQAARIVSANQRIPVTRRRPHVRPG